MKANIFKIIVTLLFGIWNFTSCGEKEQKADSVIASNLLKSGMADTTQLTGNWELVKFAYTTDGNVISDVADISNVAIGLMALNYIEITIPNKEDFLSLCDRKSELCKFDLANICSFSFCHNIFCYSISENLTNFIMFLPPVVMINITLTKDGNDVFDALKNIYSFVIRDDELLIHFNGAKRKNLLILKKQQL
jgi:hypothetical protein